MQQAAVSSPTGLNGDRPTSRTRHSHITQIPSVSGSRDRGVGAVDHGRIVGQHVPQGGGCRRRPRILVAQRHVTLRPVLQHTRRRHRQGQLRLCSHRNGAQGTIVKAGRRAHTDAIDQRRIICQTRRYCDLVVERHLSSRIKLKV